MEMSRISLVYFLFSKSFSLYQVLPKSCNKCTLGLELFDDFAVKKVFLRFRSVKTFRDLLLLLFV